MVYLDIISESGDGLGLVSDNTVPRIGECISIIDNLKNVVHYDLEIIGVKRVYGKIPEYGHAIELSKMIIIVKSIEKDDRIRSRE